MTARPAARTPALLLGLALCAFAACRTSLPLIGNGCLREHRPRGKPVAEAAILDALVAACKQDSGPCRFKECKKAGDHHVCNSSRLITEQAAVCLAKREKLKPGIGEPKAALVYSVQYQRLLWRVDNTLYATSQLVPLGGESVVLDAVDGRVVAKTPWSRSER
jgi:hypothetical protein